MVSAESGERREREEKSRDFPGKNRLGFPGEVHSHSSGHVSGVSPYGRVAIESSSTRRAFDRSQLPKREREEREEREREREREEITATRAPFPAAITQGVRTFVLYGWDWLGEERETGRIWRLEMPENALLSLYAVFACVCLRA